MIPPAIPALPEVRRAIVAERLRWLSLAYQISGAIGAICVSFLLIHLCFLATISFLPNSVWNGDVQPRVSQQSGAISPRVQSPATHSEGPPLLFFRLVAGIIGIIIVAGWTLGGLTFYAGRCLRHRRHRAFVLIMAGVNCLWIPYGTLLGIATFLALSTDDARAEFPA
jgi:hypothetical protein